MPTLNVPVGNGREFVEYICNRYRREEIEHAVTELGIEVSGGVSQKPNKQSLAAILARRMLDEEIDAETIIRTLETFRMGQTPRTVDPPKDISLKNVKASPTADQPSRNSWMTRLARWFSQ